MKDSFVFYRSFYESIKNLDKDIQIEIYNAICEYSLNDVQVELSPIATAIFTLIKPNIDNATKRYNASVENGKKGGRPKKNENLEKPSDNLNKPSDNLNKTKVEPNENLNVYEDVYVDVDVNDNVNVDGDENVNKEIGGSNILSFIPKDEEEILKEEFEKLWKLYPKKVGKEKSFNKYKKYRTSKGDEYCTYDEVLTGLNKYLKYIEQNSWYSPKDGSTWFNNMSWKDEYEIKEEPIWLNEPIEKIEPTVEERSELERLLEEFR